MTIIGWIGSHENCPMMSLSANTIAAKLNNHF